MKTKSTNKNQVRDLVLRIRSGLARGSGRKLASRETTAKALRVSPGSIYNWEHGKAVPSPRVLETLERVARDSDSKVGGPVAPAAERLARMYHAIALCGDLDEARRTFERAASSLS